MTMNLGGFDHPFVEADKNKAEVLDAIVKRREHRNIEWSLCFENICISCVRFTCLLVFFVLSCVDVVLCFMFSPGVQC